eukprot:591257-Alexandrium_andersonii.AAC.1
MNGHTFLPVLLLGGLADKWQRASVPWCGGALAARMRRYMRLPRRMAQVQCGGSDAFPPCARSCCA